MALPLQKQVHKVDLTLAGNLGGLIDAGVPIGVHHGGLLDLKQAMLHGALRDAALDLQDAQQQARAERRGEIHQAQALAMLAASGRK